MDNNTQSKFLTQHSLYVGDLDPSVTENQLAHIFSKFGELDSTVLCQDGMTQQSLCYGFVNFLRLGDAKRAIDALNYSMINGKSIRIMWQQPNSETRNNGIGNLFVKNLNDSIDNKKLNKIFSKFGNILSSKVAVLEDGKSKGYGFVQYENQESANNALQNLNGSIVEGKPLYVAHHIKKSNRTQSFNNLYVKNLELNFTEEFLKEKFSKFGNITSLVISRDVNGVSRGFGFVNFENADDAKRAMETMHGTQLGKKVLYVARAQKMVERKQILTMRQKQNQMIKGRNLYVKNINDDVDENTLKAHFSQFGSIISVKIMRTCNGISKGFGFVLFSQLEEARRAINALNGVMYHGKPLYVAPAQNKEERKLLLQSLQEAGLSRLSTYTLPNFYPSRGPAPVICQPIDYLRLGWRPPFQPPLPSMIAADSTRQHGGRMINNGYVNNYYTRPFMPIATQPEQNTQFMQTYKYPNHQQMTRQVTNIANGHARASNSITDSQNLSSMLAAATPDQRKVILRHRLYPLVRKLKKDLCSNVIELLLEMDNSELLVLLDSPESLAAKVEEALLLLEDTKATNCT
ncbi:hypothetical protein ACOSQ3_016400 [Xanthoceras sorbifolium]